MKLKVANLYDLSIGLDDLSQKELSISISLKIQRAQKIISEELIASENVRQQVIQKYKDRELDNGGVKIKKDKLREFEEEMNELMKQELDVKLDKISIKDLENEEIKIKPKILMNLETILNAE